MNFAIKATYCETSDGKCIPIFKNPKEMAFKKSNKGCIAVYRSDAWLDENGDLKFTFYAEDGLTFEEASNDPNNKLVPVFKDGKMLKEYSLNEIRDRLWEGKF